ncbi:MAG TPA: isochorismatase family cysteine hydrolase [Iamia sp.]|nr:isochorismatase family cysteine hydrolase [Iamia sp.]
MSFIRTTVTPCDARRIERTHDWEIPAREVARHVERRGRRHAYETLDAVATALVVIDLMAFFVETTPYARGIVDPVNRLAGALRAAGGTVAWVTPAVGPPTDWARAFYGDAVAETYAASGAEPWAALDVAPGDLRVEKTSASALFPGRSPLDGLLRDRGIDTVLVAGAVTSVCVEATARDAATLGYRTVVVADACAGVDDAAHNATLRTIYRSYGDVRPTPDLIDLLLDASQVLHHPDGVSH